MTDNPSDVEKYAAHDHEIHVRVSETIDITRSDERRDKVMPMTDSAAGSRVTRQQVAEAFLPNKLVAAAMRTGRFAARSAGRHVQSRRKYPEVPLPRPTIARLATVFLEETMLGAASSLCAVLKDADEVRRIRRQTDIAVDLFAEQGWLHDPTGYHPAPPPPSHATLEAVQYGGVRYSRLSFDSGYQPVEGLPGADNWLALKPNTRCHAHVLEHRGAPRPWVVYLHGFGMGRPMDFWIWGALRYFRDLGFNVLAPVLPLHGTRRSGGAQLVSLDWVANVHGLTQTVWDVRRCLAWIRQRGALSVALYGMSLGGYTAALVAGLDRELGGVIAGVPASTIHRPIMAAFDRDATALKALTAHGIVGPHTETVHRVITPTALACQVPRERRYIYAGIADRISTPNQAYALWEHWEKPSMRWCQSSHVFTMISADIRQFVQNAVVASCSASPPRPALPSHTDTG